MVSSDLPQEILIDIFSRFPAKSVGQCRCLSKPWRDILSSFNFIKSHLNRKTEQQSLILISPSHSIPTIPTINDDAVSRKLELIKNWVEVVGCCDGLVLLKNGGCEMFLVNPITLEEAKIPDSPLALPIGESLSMHGYGYDSSIDDYKIVTLSYYDTDNEDEPDCVDTFVDVYYVKRGVWKRVESSPYYHDVPELDSGALLSGALHWLASSRESTHRTVIAAFNLVDEVFTENPAPPGVSVDIFMFSKLSVLGGCLCILDARSMLDACPIDIWIMKEYGCAESWTKFSFNSKWDIFKPLCFIGDEEVVLVTDDETLVIHNMKEGTSRNMIVDGVPARFMDGSTFMGSLVSPHFT